MRLEHHLVGGYVRYISPYIIIIIIVEPVLEGVGVISYIQVVHFTYMNSPPACLNPPF